MCVGWCNASSLHPSFLLLYLIYSYINATVRVGISDVSVQLILVRNMVSVAMKREFKNNCRSKNWRSDSKIIEKEQKQTKFSCTEDSFYKCSPK